MKVTKIDRDSYLVKKNEKHYWVTGIGGNESSIDETIKSILFSHTESQHCHG